MEKKDQWNIGYWIVAGLLLLTLQNYWQAAKTVEPVPYSEFEKALAEGRVAEVLVSDRTVTGHLKSPDSRGKTTIVATRVEPDLAERLSKYDVPYARVVESTWLRDVLSWILPAVAFFGVWFFLFRRFAEKQGMGGFLSIGKSRAKVFMEKNTGVTFADVAGVDEAKAELVEIVDFLKNPQEYGRLGARIPEGRVAGRPTGHRQDIAGQGCCRRGRRCPSSPSPDQSLSRCSSAWVRRACATCSSRPAGRRRPSSSSTSSMRWAAHAASAAPSAATTSASRPSTSCSRRWTASTARSG